MIGTGAELPDLRKSPKLWLWLGLEEDDCCHFTSQLTVVLWQSWSAGLAFLSLVGLSCITELPWPI